MSCNYFPSIFYLLLGKGEVVGKYIQTKASSGLFVKAERDRAEEKADTRRLTSSPTRAVSFRDVHANQERERERVYFNPKSVSK